MNPQVSVLVLCYNSAATLRECLDSLLAQTFKNFEILIIDGGSTDGSLEIIKTIQDPRLRLVPQIGKGLAEARNQGLGEAACELVAYLDSDDVAEPTRLEKQFKFLSENPSYVLVGSWIKLIDSESKQTAERRYVDDAEEIQEALSSYNPIPNPGVMFRKSAALKAGSYRHVYPEDYDLWIRMSELGKFKNLPEFLTRYRIHSSGSKMQTTRWQQWISITMRYRYWRAGKLKLTVKAVFNNLAQLVLLAFPPKFVVWVFQRVVRNGKI